MSSILAAFHRRAANAAIPRDFKISGGILNRLLTTTTVASSPTQQSPSSSTQTAPLATAATTARATTTSASPALSTSSTKPPTAVVMLNMGGPAIPTLEKVEDFLTRLFSDNMIINLGKFQWLGKYIAKRRSPKIQEQYKEIGGSPLRKWTELQGQEMCKILDEISPSTAPHKPYAMFRYADPLTEETLDQMAADGVTRAVAFSQYPMYSCTTSGSSLSHLWSALQSSNRASTFTWSVIDRWHDHPLFIKAVARRVQLGLEQFEKSDLSKVLLLFSAHSIPQKTASRGDQYPWEIAHTVQLVMRELQNSGVSLPFLLCWQSKVGYLPWLEPSTAAVIERLGATGRKHALVVPIAFTSDHVETLYEIDIEYQHLAQKSGLTHFKRAPSLNDEPLLFKAQAEIVASHLQSGKSFESQQYRVKCVDCANPLCRTVLNPVSPFETSPGNSLSS